MLFSSMEKIAFTESSYLKDLYSKPCMCVALHVLCTPAQYEANVSQ